MRIIAGKLKNRKLLESSHLKDLRPTTDKNRETVFNILNSAKFLQEIDFSLQDCNVLDLCCGTGAIAFEAISRGASYVLLVDNNSKHLEIAKQNAQKFAVENEVEFLLCDAEKLPFAKKVFNLIFVDPPYSVNTKKMVTNLLEKKYLDKNSLIIIESDKNFEDNFAGLKLIDSRIFGISKINFYLNK
ncbi:MAG TPA: 16S rRNA (guanine(966)-N(2))-methyltransferase RsmD [Rickettsiales bacterium]|nr:16S rRNA (guanine(966)-N(2))-methyltransferase RsmD [Rickettsiales bacterium]